MRTDESTPAVGSSEGRRRENGSLGSYTRLAESVKSLGLQTGLPGLPVPHLPSRSVPETVGAYTMDQARPALAAADALLLSLESESWTPYFLEIVCIRFRDRMRAARSLEVEA